MGGRIGLHFTQRPQELQTKNGECFEKGDAEFFIV